MQTHVEELPLEIWLIVFQYLEAHDIFGAFQTLNCHFDQILSSNQLSLYVRLKETDNNHLENPNNPFWSDSALHRIRCLRPGVQSRSTYFLEFLRWHAEKLIRLQSLTIKTQIRGISLLPSVCQSLKLLNRLEYLSISCGSYKVIFDTILTLPTLRTCQLILKQSPLSIDDLHLQHVNSSIKQLFLVFLDRIDFPLVNLLLTHTPKLKRLELTGSSFSFFPISLFAEASLILPELRVLKLKLESGHFTSDCFECFHTTLPSLKHFYFYYTKHILSEMFLDRFITDWWSIIESIQCFDIHIKGHILIDESDPSIQTNLKKNRQILAEKIKRPNGNWKFEWNEQDIAQLRLVEINIRKY